MRSFEFSRKRVNGEVVHEPHEGGIMGEVKAFPDAQIPEYQTKNSAGADFFCAEEVVIPSIWRGVAQTLKSDVAGLISKLGVCSDTSTHDKDDEFLKPTLVHTGIKASMEEDEVLELYNRSSNPKKLGLILANSVGVVDADYYNNKDNDGEIMFAFFNFKPWDVTLKVGDRIGQGVFKKVLRPTVGLRVKDTEREGGFGSTN